MKVYINREAFIYIELQQERGVTAQQLSDKMGSTKKSAASWLSKWTTLGYLRYVRERGKGKQRVGVYCIDSTCKWWGEKTFESEKGVI